jgi:antirestriction protein ArdC
MEAPASFSELLHSAVTEPGTISAAYSAFYNYSFGNQLLALSQCMQRGITPGPLATFPRWKALGRYVRKGERAIVLCQPLTIRRKGEPTDANTDNEPEAFTRFVYRNSWFVLSQTSGADLPPAPIPSWDRTRALAALDITEEAFAHMDGNVQGYARQRVIAVSPVAAMPHKTTFHEVAHILLGHTTEGEQADSDVTPRNVREVETESVAMLCCAALGLPGVAFSRGYIQSWWSAGEAIPETSARRVLKTADQILKAGSASTSEGAAA